MTSPERPELDYARPAEFERERLTVQGWFNLVGLIILIGIGLYVLSQVALFCIAIFFPRG